MFKKIRFILLLPLGILLTYLFSLSTDFTERFYSMGINRYFRQGLSLLTGILPFSLIEFLIIVLIIFIIAYVIVFIRKLVTSKNKKKTTFNFFMLTINVICIIYFADIVLWGINYSRKPISTITKLDVRPSSQKELEQLCANLITEANVLRTTLPEDSKGIVTYSGGYKTMLNKADSGYIAISKEIPELSGKYGKPKAVFFSNLMNYTGIIGIYCPFTAEANIDVCMPEFDIPNTICHEMAHQRGFAKEDEANFISYLTCEKNSDAFFRYSGDMLAIIYSMNALAANDYEKFKEIAKKYSPAVARDLNYDYDFWQQYQGNVQKISDKINNTYLKFNGEKDGVQSYGRMVDLLLANQRTKKTGDN